MLVMIMSVMAEPERFLAMANFIEIWCWILGFRKKSSEADILCTLWKSIKNKSCSEGEECKTTYWKNIKLCVWTFTIFDFTFYVFWFYIFPKQSCFSKNALHFTLHSPLEKHQVMFFWTFTSFKKQITLPRRHIYVFGKTYFNPPALGETSHKCFW